MKKEFIKNNAVFIIIGLILLIGNIIIDLGLLPLDLFKNTQVLFWGATVLSKICSTVGLALVIGFITKFINKKQEEEQNNKEADIKTTLSLINKEIHNSAYSRDCIESLTDEKKKDIVANCLLVSCSEKQKYYLEHKVAQIYNYSKLNVRSNIDYTTTASKENGKVKLRTVMSYRIYKVDNCYPKIIHTFDKPTSRVLSMLILGGENNNRKKYEVPESELCTKEVIFHQRERYYINEIDVPENLKDESSLSLKITVEEEGHDHWAHLVWMSLYPTDTISYRVICKDNLTIKDPHIFDNQEGLYFVHKETNTNGQVNEYTITCDEWTDQYTGFSLIISEP